MVGDTVAKTPWLRGDSPWDSSFYTAIQAFVSTALFSRHMFAVQSLLPYRSWRATHSGPRLIRDFAGAPTVERIPLVHEESAILPRFRG